jgi:hypothetical protein
MLADGTKPWAHLCERAATEHDPVRLMELIHEINRLLSAEMPSSRLEVPRYLLHVFKQDAPLQSLALGLTLHDQNRFEGTLAISSWGSWTSLSDALLEAGIQQPELEEAQLVLRTEGLYTFAAIALDDSQIERLGFTKAKAAL